MEKKRLSVKFLISLPENNFIGQRNLMGYSPVGGKDSDMTEQLSTRTHTHKHCVAGSHTLKSIQESKARPGACKSAVLCLVAQSCPTLCDPMDCSSPGSSVHRGSPGRNTGMGCHALLQGIFPTQVSCIAGGFFFYHLSH